MARLLDYKKTTKPSSRWWFSGFLVIKQKYLTKRSMLIHVLYCSSCIFLPSRHSFLRALALTYLCTCKEQIFVSLPQIVTPAIIVEEFQQSLDENRTRVLLVRYFGLFKRKTLNHHRYNGILVDLYSSTNLKKEYTHFTAFIYNIDFFWITFHS